MFSSPEEPDPWASSRVEEDRASTIRQRTVDGSDDEHEDGEDHDFEQGASYSTRMEELLTEGEDSDDSDEEFVYTGVDASLSTENYREQLREVLGPDQEDAKDESHEETSSENEKPAVVVDDAHSEVASDYAPSSSQEASVFATPPRIDSPAPGVSHDTFKSLNPYLHPAVSRLRSYTPQISPSSPASNAAFHVSPPPSHFSEISRISSLSNLHELPSPTDNSPDREVFRWAHLRSITHVIYGSIEDSPKASTVLGSVLGKSKMGSPTVFVVSGVVCVGTDSGRAFVFDFKQNLRCICGDENSSKTVGTVSAMALSHDHTFLALGHATGHIQLFDLAHPQKPARHVPPITLTAVRSGRHEGHLKGSRIIDIGFIGKRHTAVASADDRGLAFYHSLGKMLFVDAPDILRILGKYPEDELADPPAPRKPASDTVHPSQSAQNGSGHATPHPRRSKYTILAMMSLPLGTSHPTDTFNIIALLTPAKLVVVGLKPSPRTWFKCARSDDVKESRSKSRSKGSLAWCPSILLGSSGAGKQDPAKTAPKLAYTWGDILHVIRISETKINHSTKNPRSGKVAEVKVGIIIYESIGKWQLDERDGGIIALQWLNGNQIIILTTSMLLLYDVQESKIIERVKFDSSSLVSTSFSSTANGSSSSAASTEDVTHSICVYKEKLFALGRTHVQVGTLLTWADRILSFVQDGDFLGAIDLTRAYYVGDAPGNRNNLPDDFQMRREVVGARLRDLMVASMRYSFSEDRMTDGTHVTPDNRGVDRTSMFEGLVASCARACVTLQDLEFLFEDLFLQYDDHGISRIFLKQLEPFVLSNQIRDVPPRITQRLVAMHDEDGRPDLVERVIWHIDPACLDINQTIQLCQQHQLYDALIYIYTRAMKDYVSPVVELLGLIRKVHQYRTRRLENAVKDLPNREDVAMEPIVLNAYKVYPYLANVLSGLSYPSLEPLDESEAFQAKKDVYTFLFYGRSSVWPAGDGGKLVLTSDEEGGAEPTFPYARTLLRFDAESLLHTLDIAFEDSFLNDETQGVSRLVIVKTLLEILASSNSSSLAPAAVTFVNIFVARNVPKYPQFIQIAPSVSQNILISLAQDPDVDTREDRQLAAEYLLSVYTPHEGDGILKLFDAAGFFRILRSWHRHEKRWAPLLSTYLRDPDMHAPELFGHVDEVLDTATGLNKATIPRDLLASLEDALPQLLRTSVTWTASILDKHTPDLHRKALAILETDLNSERFPYLQHLLGRPQSENDEDVVSSLHPRPSMHIPKDLRQLFIRLQCQHDPSGVIDALRHLPSDDLDLSELLKSCEDLGVYDAVVWALNWKGDSRGALSKAELYEKQMTLRIVSLFGSSVTPQSVDIEQAVKVLESVGRTAMSVCLELSKQRSVIDIPLEDVWFHLLRSQITCVQNVSSCQPQTTSSTSDELSAAQIHQRTLSSLRSLLQESFTSLASMSSTRAVSFPILFKRLVDSATQSHSSNHATYTEFRTILSGMLESYHSEGDMLQITKRLIDRDLFETVEIATSERVKGWAPSTGSCSICLQALLSHRDPAPINRSTPEDTGKSEIVVSRTGMIYHQICSTGNS